MPIAIPRWRTNHCDANEQMHQSKCERGRSQRRTDIADAKHQAAQHDRDHDAEVVAASYKTYDAASKLHFLRRCRGMSFQEIELAIAPVHQLTILSSLGQFKKGARLLSL